MTGQWWHVETVRIVLPSGVGYGTKFVYFTFRAFDQVYLNLRGLIEAAFAQKQETLWRIKLKEDLAKEKAENMVNEGSQTPDFSDEDLDSWFSAENDPAEKDDAPSD